MGTAIKAITISFFLTILLGWTIEISWGAENSAAIIQGEPLVVHFKEGKSGLSPADQEKIKRMLDEFGGNQEYKLLVVGYTDSSGDSKKNIKLSYERAQAVRKAIITSIGLSAKNVLAMGRGDENPIADNTTQAGREKNRRVEIFLVQVVSGTLKEERAQLLEAHRVAIEAMVQDARIKLRQHRINDAFRILRQAKAEGGDRYSSWHSMYGVTGYYAGVEPKKVKAHLSAAIQLDAFNQEARDYLGRLAARKMVADGVVTPEMGKSARAPIAVSSDAQLYEFLRQFNVQPLSHIQIVQGPIEVWHCRDSQGRSVDYFFDRSQVYTWAYTASDQADHGKPGTDHSSINSPVAPDIHKPAAFSTDKSDSQVWESKLNR